MDRGEANMAGDGVNPGNAQAAVVPPRRVKWYSKGGKGFQAAALLLIVASLSACGFLMACLLRAPGPSSGAGAGTEKEMAGRLAKYHLFRDWPKDRNPDLVLVLTGERHGYILPCGCSSPQVGGVERLYNFVRLLKEERGWSVAALDLGDNPQKEGPAQLPNIQGALKYFYTMRAMEKIGFSATSFGEYEAALPLTTAIDQLFQNPNLTLPTVLACNLHNREKLFKIDDTEQIAAWKLVQPQGSKLQVGIIGAIGVEVGDAIEKQTGLPFDALADLIDPETKRPKPGRLPAALKDLNAHKPDLRVLLYHGKPELGTKLAKAIPQFDVILCQSDAELAPSKVEQVGNTTLVPGLGHKGKEIGVLGVYRTGNAKNPFEMRYQLVSLGEEYLTPKDEEKGHPILKLMEEYTLELKTGDYLHKFPRNRPIPAEFKGLDAEYVGSDACKSCHKHAYKIWADSKHANAYKTLEEAQRPTNRQYDGECIVCHTIGFTQKTGFVDVKTTPKLMNVGCESCHGPGSAHIKAKHNLAIHDLMNPYKAKPEETPAQNKVRVQRLNDFCQKCHDQENDVHWNFVKRWPEIEHMEPKKNNDD
jgi:hypothetical protein